MAEIIHRLLLQNNCNTTFCFAFLVDGAFKLGSFTCSSSVVGHTKTIVVRRFGERRKGSKDKQGRRK